MLNRIKSSPVPFFGLLQGLWLATLTLAAAFEWWQWSSDQEAAVSAGWLALTGVATWLLTGKTSFAVTPVENPKDNDLTPLVPSVPEAGHP